MKILLSILAILALVFLIGCSARDTGNISKKELENLANKYGGVYVFNKKYLEEIEKREADREKLRKSIDINKENYFDGIERIDKQLPQILSNGRPYYIRSSEYRRKNNKALPDTDKSYYTRIENVIGQENLKKYMPSMILGYFYMKDNKLIPISISVLYSYNIKSYGLYGDEGRGIRFSNTQEYIINHHNKFYMQDIEK